eukprot:CAMPEP_0175875666 /NCGR_PEP_ID=MMETSP0107_2-20121207/39586_1 /TAXON_ID=195067 ORGANISM="Goniomonas pacifica, Strain CCMP1869" /NCGR_SAMPLE_ID=MMETSP0107_2 /ASSEMBLY_ACC=CAM_ASM_000203 /LENGTH=194 /DNA_ID=CAMNT_0017194719 /DNA_START=107 /DNA_END=692 /DNA_ORIENTATION=+
MSDCGGNRAEAGGEGVVEVVHGSPSLQVPLLDLLAFNGEWQVLCQPVAVNVALGPLDDRPSTVDLMKSCPTNSGETSIVVIRSQSWTRLTIGSKQRVVGYLPRHRSIAVNETSPALEPFSCDAEPLGGALDRGLVGGVVREEGLLVAAACAEVLVAVGRGVTELRLLQEPLQSIPRTALDRVGRDLAMVRNAAS